MADINWQALAQPFEPHEVKWRVLRKSKSNTKYGECIPYVDARNIYQRLDDVVGPGGWQNDVTEWGHGGAVATIRIKVGSEWLSKSDVGFRVESERQSDEVKVKGDPSDAVKRAAVLWGIGRYLYQSDSVWCNLDDFGNILDTPELTFTGSPQFMKQGQPQQQRKSDKKQQRQPDNLQQNAADAVSFPAGYLDDLAKQTAAALNITPEQARVGIGNHVKAGGIVPEMSLEDALQYVQDKAAEKKAANGK